METASLFWKNSTEQYGHGSVRFHGTEPKACSVLFLNGLVPLWVGSFSVRSVLHNRTESMFGSVLHRFGSGRFGFLVRTVPIVWAEKSPV